MGQLETTRDRFLGGALDVIQPRTGYRAGMDAVLLGASIRAEAGQQNCTICPAGSFCGEGATAPSRLVRVGGRVRVGLTLTLTL